MKINSKNLILIAITLFLGMLLAGTTVFAATTLKIGETITLDAYDASTSYPASSVSRAYMWSSSNSSVLQIVNKSGSSCTVRAVGPGTATIENTQSITYTYQDPILGSMPGWETGYGGSWTIKVEKREPTAISLPETTSVFSETSRKISVSVKPADANEVCTWSSSDTNIARVDENGMVSGVNVGEATITAVSVNGLKSSCVVKILPPEVEFLSSFPSNNSVSGRMSFVDIKFRHDILKSDTFSSIKITDKQTSKTIKYTSSVSGKTLKLSSDKFLLGHSYTVKIPADAISNRYGKKLQKDVTISFRLKPMTLLRTYPEEGEAMSGASSLVAFDFDTKVFLVDNVSSKISFTDAKTGKNCKFKAYVSGKTLIIEPTSVTPKTSYNIKIPAGCLLNENKVPSDEDINFEFYTLSKPLALESTIPSDDYDTCYDTINITAKYSAPVSSGKIIVKDAITEETISGITSISGDTLTFTSSSYSLKPGGLYFFEIPAGSVKNDDYAVNTSVKKFFTYMTGKPEITIDRNNQLTIKAMEGAEIYYTIDGSNPLSGKKYTDTVYVPDTEGVTVKAIAIKNGVVSKVTSRTLQKASGGGNLVMSGTSGGYRDFLDIISVSDGYVAVGGKTAEKYDKNLKLIWSKLLDDIGASVSDVVAKDGIYFVVGSEFGILSIAAIDAGSGTVLKTKDIENGINTFAGAVPSDRGFAIVAKKDEKPVWIDFDKNLEIVSTKSFDDVFAVPKDVIEDNNGYIIVGETRNGALIYKLDRSGNEVWKQTFGSILQAGSFNSVAKTKDGYLVAGVSANFNNAGDNIDTKKPVVGLYSYDGKKIYVESNYEFEKVENLYTDGNVIYALIGNDSVMAIDADLKTLAKQKIKGATVSSVIGENGKLICSGRIRSREIGKSDYPIFKDKTAIGSYDAYIYTFDITEKDPGETSQSSVNTGNSASGATQAIYILGPDKIDSAVKYKVISVPASGSKLKYKVSDSGIAGFSSDGVLTPRKSGNVTITVSDGDVSASRNVEVIVNESDRIFLTINSKDAKVFGKKVSNDVAPIIENSRTMLPARFVAENLGAKVYWDGDKQMVTIEKENKEIKIFIDSHIAYVNDQAYFLDSPAFIRSERTYTPVRFICENLNARVEWDQTAMTAIIIK